MRTATDSRSFTSLFVDRYVPPTSSSSTRYRGFMSTVYISTVQGDIVYFDFSVVQPVGHIGCTTGQSRMTGADSTGRFLVQSPRSPRPYLILLANDQDTRRHQIIKEVFDCIMSTGFRTNGALERVVVPLSLRLCLDLRPWCCSSKCLPKLPSLPTFGRKQVFGARRDVSAAL